ECRMNRCRHFAHHPAIAILCSFINGFPPTPRDRNSRWQFRRREGIFVPSMVEYISADDKTLAVFVSGNSSPEETRFLTTNDEPIQWGIGVFRKGSRVEPHCHASTPVVITEFQEFIMIRKGGATAHGFDPAG